MISPEELLTWPEQERLNYLLNIATSKERREYLAHRASSYPKEFINKMADFFLKAASSATNEDDFISDIEFGICLKEKAKESK